MIDQIKTFEERKEQIIAKGKEKGFITYEELANELKGLDLDSDSLDDLYNSLVENGIEIDDNKIRVYLDEEELDKFSTNKEELEVCEKVYISSDILLTSEQEEIFENNNIEVYIIPEYYFEDEIKEVM